MDHGDVFILRAGETYREEAVTSLVPERYGDLDTSGLKVTVAGGENDIRSS